jgi:hypothetical protein
MRPVWLDPVTDAVLEATQAPDVDALKGELLREWGSSEVWRLSYGLRSVIVNLEQEPTAEGFLAAAELLASMRAKPVEGPSGFTSERLADLVDRIDPMEPDLREHLLAKAVPALDDLHRQAPPAVIHGDLGEL